MAKIYHPYKSQLPMLSDVKDSRADGVSYERMRAMSLQHLEATFPEKKWEDFSQPGLQQMRLVFDDRTSMKRTEAFLKSLSDVRFSPGSIWEIEVVGGGSCMGNLTLLLNTFEAIPNITVFQWKTEFLLPRNILQLLESRHTTCRLYYQMPFYSSRHLGRCYGGDDEEDLEYEGILDTSPNGLLDPESIMNSKSLYSLSASIEYGGYSESKRINMVYRALTTCPNIRELKLSIGHFGCVVAWGQPYAFDFTQGDNPIPPLESLVLNGYDFEGKPSGQEWMEWEAEKPGANILNFPWNKLPQSVIDWFGYESIKNMGGLESYFVKRDHSQLKPGEKTNLDRWMEVMDWSHLHTLKLTKPSRYELQMLSGSVLPSLKNVTFTGGYHTSAVVDFLANTSSPLESIALERTAGCLTEKILDVVTQHHCPTLQTFKFNRSGFINSTQLSHLVHDCPNLRGLDIDLNVKTGWDYEILDTLASFPELTELTLRIETQFASPNDPADWISYPPHVRESRWEALRTVRLGLAGYLRKKKVGKAFRELEIV
jgi:hypothetical protein